MDLIAQNIVQANVVEFEADLLDTFALYWERIIPDKKSSIVYPLWHLQSEGFWHLLPRPGKAQALEHGGSITSLGKLKDAVLGAKFDDPLFEFLQIENSRDDLRRVLIETYFAPDTRAVLVELGEIAKQTFEYSQELQTSSQEDFKLIKETPQVSYQYRSEARSAAFRRLVTEAYNHTCVVCRLRLLTPEGHTSVVAAHIVPWRDSRNDDPRNGLALCGVHHWAFDEGLIGVDNDYEILVSPVVSIEGNTADRLLRFFNQKLYLPQDDKLLPAREALSWHRRNSYRYE